MVCILFMLISILYRHLAIGCGDKVDVYDTLSGNMLCQCKTGINIASSVHFTNRKY